MADALYQLLGLFGYGHPLHPVVVHLIIGPIIAALAFYLVAWAFGKPAFYKTARQLTVFSLITWFPAVIVGTFDWLHFYGGSPSMTEIAVKSAGAGVLLLILVGNIVLFRRLEPGSKIHLVLYLAAAATVGFIGLMGGEIVYGAKKEAAPASQTVQAAADASGFKHVQAEGYSFDWKVEGPNVRMRVSYATSGWVGVGFAKDPLMQGAHIIIGYVDEAGKPVIQDHFGYSGHAHAAEEKVGGKSSISDLTGKLEAGVTTLEWTMPLNTGNPKDPVLVPGEAVQVLFAHGDPEAKDVTSYHGREGRTVVKLTL